MAVGVVNLCEGVGHQVYHTSLVVAIDKYADEDIHKTSHAQIHGLVRTAGISKINEILTNRYFNQLSCKL